MSKNSGHKNIGNDELFNEFSRAAARACSPVSRYNLALSKINQGALKTQVQHFVGENVAWEKVTTN